MIDARIRAHVEEIAAEHGGTVTWFDQPDVASEVAAAEAVARVLHEDGRCGESEWSCSFCEAEAVR